MKPFDTWVYQRERRQLIRRMMAMRDDLRKHRDQIAKLYEKSKSFPTAADLVIEKSNWLLQELNKHLIRHGQ